MIKVTRDFTHICNIVNKTELRTFTLYSSLSGQLPGYIELIARLDNAKDLPSNYTRLYGLISDKSWAMLYSLPPSTVMISIYARYRIPYQPKHSEEIWLSSTAQYSSNMSSDDRLDDLSHSLGDLDSKLNEILSSIDSLLAVEQEPITMLKIVQRDSNTWGYQWHYGALLWTSVLYGQNKTGSITVGDFKLASRLHICVGGHGDTTQSFVEVLDAVDNSVILSHTLASLLLIANNNSHATADSPIGVTINTLPHTGKLARLRVRDDHSGGNGWASVIFSTLLIE